MIKDNQTRRNEFKKELSGSSFLGFSFGQKKQFSVRWEDMRRWLGSRATKKLPKSPSKMLQHCKFEICVFGKWNMFWKIPEIYQMVWLRDFLHSKEISVIKFPALAQNVWERNRCWSSIEPITFRKNVTLHFKWGASIIAIFPKLAGLKIATCWKSHRNMMIHKCLFETLLHPHIFESTVVTCCLRRKQTLVFMSSYHKVGNHKNVAGCCFINHSFYWNDHHLAQILPLTVKVLNQSRNVNSTKSLDFSLFSPLMSILSTSTPSLSHALRQEFIPHLRSWNVFQILEAKIPDKTWPKKEGLRHEPEYHQYKSSQNLKKKVGIFKYLHIFTSQNLQQKSSSHLQSPPFRVAWLQSCRLPAARG